jgi:hypothetical protein
MPVKRLYDDPALPVREIRFADIVNMPPLLQQQASLTPLEKAEVGLIIVALQPQVIVETGVWRGRTTRFLSELMMRNRINGKVYGFDYPDVIDELFEINPYLKSASNVEFVKGILPASMKDWLTRTSDLMIDFALVDATHSYNAVYDELRLIAPRLKQDGYIFCHDYDLDKKDHIGVAVAIDDFCRRSGFAVIPLHSRPPAPKTDVSWQSALLHRKLKLTWSQRMIHYREDVRERYPRLTAFQRRLRGIK